MMVADKPIHGGRHGEQSSKTATDFDIINGRLEPKTLGECIDAIVVANIRMWHAQEQIFELDTLERMTKDEMFSVLKYASWLNLERNKYMDGSDAVVATSLESMLARPLQQKSVAFDPCEIVWEAA